MLTNFIWTCPARNQIPLSPRTEEGKAVAFSHFRYDMDYDDEVLLIILDLENFPTFYI